MREGEGNAGRGRGAGRRRWNRPVSGIPTAGMADIAFLLLIFFMLIVYEPDRTAVDLPNSEIRAGSDSKAALVILAVGDGGPSDVVFRFTDGVHESKVIPGVEAVRAEAGRVLSIDPGKLFKIKADGTVSARLVTRVFDALSDAGAGTILMLTDPRDSGGRSES